MAQESISASSKYWDDKKIELTENTKKNILKKAYALDAETMLSQYNLEGDDAAKALEANGITQEALLQNQNTYTYLGLSAINDLEQNASKQTRTSAVINLTKLGFTNVYESNTQNFITPPEEQKEEEPVQRQEEPQQESRVQYLRRTRSPPPEPQQYYEEPQYQQEGPSPRAQLRGAARFIPNAVHQYISRGNPNQMTPARVAPNPGAYVRPPVRQSPVHTQTQAKRYAPQQPRSLLNSDMARKLGGRIAPSSVRTLAPRAKFGLGGKK